MRQRGLTLIEMMLALSLGTVMLLGVVHLLQHNLRLYHQQQALAGTHDDQRFLIHTLRHAIHMSGYLPCSTLSQHPQLNRAAFSVISAKKMRNTYRWAHDISAGSVALMITYAAPRAENFHNVKSSRPKIIDDCVHALYANPQQVNDHFFNHSAQQAKLVQQWFYLRSSTDGLSQGLFKREGQRSEELAVSIKHISLQCSHDHKHFQACTHTSIWQWVKVTLTFSKQKLSFLTKRYNL